MAAKRRRASAQSSMAAAKPRPVSAQFNMTATKRFYYSPSLPSAYASVDKLAAALKAEPRSAVKEWLLKQDPFTLHRRSRKRFQRNPYTVTNIMEVWEADLMDMRTLSKYNDKYTYLLSVIDTFSKYLHIVPLRAKTGTAVSSAFRSILEKYSKPVRRRPIWVRTDKGKEFVNRTFQAMLRKEGIQFQICKDPNVKCAIVERSHRTVREKLFRFMTHKITHRYIDVLQKFVKGYNDSVHSATGMAPSTVTESDVLAIWNRMRRKQTAIRRSAVRYSVGQHVRISKEKFKFAKGGEQNYTTEVFAISKVVRRVPRPVYELQDLRGVPINGHFYAEELSPVILTKKTTYAIDKILRRRGRGNSLEYLVRWRGYGPEFDSWIKASSVKHVGH